jgi:AcrR family transcriptional regulator
MSDVKGRTPAQARSRTRVERVLEAAEKLVARSGFAQVTMSDVARSARMPPASIYQYFANRSALMSALGVRQLEAQQALLAEALSSESLAGDPERGLDTIIDATAAFMRDNPLYDEVWSGLQADRELKRVDVEDTRQTAELMLPALEELLPLAPARRLRAIAVVLQLAVFSSVRFSLTEGACVELGPMLDDVKLLLRQYVRALVAEYGGERTKAIS